MNPKLIQEDELILQDLIVIVFGSQGEELGLDPKLVQEIEKNVKENNLILDRPFFDKILQLNQVL